MLAYGYNTGMPTEAALLDDLLEPVGRCMNRESLEKLVALRAPATVQSRLDELSQRSSSGQLSREESAEYETLVSAGTLIAVLQSKARKLLKEGEAA